MRKGRSASDLVRGCKDKRGHYRGRGSELHEARGKRADASQTATFQIGKFVVVAMRCRAVIRMMLVIVGFFCGVSSFSGRFNLLGMVMICLGMAESVRHRRHQDGRDIDEREQQSCPSVKESLHPIQHGSPGPNIDGGNSTNKADVKGRP